MIGLILSALRTHRVQALTVVLIAAFVAGSAVGVPVYVAGADASVIANEWTAAPLSGRSVQVLASVDTGDSPDRTFETEVPSRLGAAGLTTVFAAETEVGLAATSGDLFLRFVAREDVCEHVVLLAGRCPVGGGEVMLGAASAAQVRASAGRTLVVRHAVPASRDAASPSQAREAGLMIDPAQPPMTVTVVGFYRVAQPDAAYWGQEDYFLPDPDTGALTEPIFTTRGTLAALGHTQERQSVDGSLDASALAADGLAALRARVAAAMTDIQRSGQATTGIPDLLDRIDRDRSAIRQVVLLAALPLLGLGWFLLYFAVSYAVGERRGEIGVIALRGTGRVRRWSLALGEPVAACTAGFAAGALAGIAAAGTLARLVPGGTGIPPSPPALPAVARYAAVALAGGLLAVALAGRAALAGSVAELLRKVPSRAARWRAATLEGVLVAAAVAAVVQLRSSSGTLSGVMLFAPGLVVLAVALLAARLVVPVAGALGAWALRRGHLSSGLGAVSLARRPGVARLLTVLVVAVAQPLFATGAADVAAQVRAARASAALGAARVLSVAPVATARLLRAVRRADPQGRYAMAVSTVPGVSASDPPMLAVDATRLARVASWLPQYGALSAARAAARLHPAGGNAAGAGSAPGARVAGGAPAPVLIQRRQIEVDATVTQVNPASTRLFVGLITLDDSFSSIADLGTLRTGRHVYLVDTPECLVGCRLTGLLFSSENGSASASLVLHALLEGPSPAFTPVAAGLSGAGRWRAPAASGDGTPSALLAPGPDGLAVRVEAGSAVGTSRIVPADTPYPLPVISTAPLPRASLGRLGVDPLPVVRAGAASVLPGLGTSGILVDMEYADRLGASTTDAADPAVWLSSDAPPDMLARLAAAGLTVTGSRTVAADARYRSRQGPGAGLRYHLLAALLAILLGTGGLALTAAVDRRRAGYLSVLRPHGLPARTFARAQILTYAAVVAAAIALAPLAAAAAWWATGAQVPVFVDGQPPVPPPAWPAARAVLGPWLLAGVLLLAAALAVARAATPTARDLGRFDITGDVIPTKIRPAHDHGRSGRRGSRATRGSERGEP